MFSALHRINHIALRQFCLFPLDCCRRLAGNVINDSVDPTHFVNDSAADDIQNLIRDSCPISSHEVSGGDTTQCKSIIIGAAIPHDTNRTHVGQNSEILMDLVCQPSIGDLFTEDPISVL